MDTNPNNPAFPFVNNEDKEAPDVNYGLTKREYFSAIAMQAIANDYLESQVDIMASHALKIADALIEKLNEKK